MAQIPGPPEKQGAGILFSCEGDVLLLLRANTKHNLNTWGLPGGNVEAGDADLLATARREAVEEMGPLPAFDLLGEVTTVRGKRGQKHFKVFLAGLTPEARADWTPTLNREHSEARWWPLEELPRAGMPLHPVPCLVLDPDLHRPAVLAALSKAGEEKGTRPDPGTVAPCSGDAVETSP